MRTMTLSLVALGLLTACSPSADEGSNVKSVQLETVYSEPADRDTPPKTMGQRDSAATQEQTDEAQIASAVSFEAQGAPEGTDALAKRLRARHVEGVPTAQDIQTMEQGAEKLLFIEANAGLMLERQRSLSLMRHVYTPAVRARLLELAGDTHALAPVRTAALRSLVAVGDPKDAETAAVLQLATESADARVRRIVENARKKAEAAQDE